MGYSIIIYPSICHTASILAIREALSELQGKGIVKQWAEAGVPFDEMLNFLGLRKYRDFEDKLLNL